MFEGSAKVGILSGSAALTLVVGFAVASGCSAKGSEVPGDHSGSGGATLVTGGSGPSSGGDSATGGTAGTGTAGGSSSSGGMGTSGGTGVGGISPDCSPTASPCQSFADCCSGLCEGGVCLECAGEGAPCGICCDGLGCVAGVCTECRADGTGCSAADQCCSGMCVGGRCGACYRLRDDCGTNEQCCSRQCVAGSCCGPETYPCSDPDDCCPGTHCSAERCVFGEGTGGSGGTTSGGCTGATPDALTTNRLWVGMASPNVGGYFITFDEADASGGTITITCAAGRAVIADNIHLELAGDAAVVDVPEDGLQISVSYISFQEMPGVESVLSAEITVTNL